MSVLWKIGGAVALMVAAYFLVTMYGESRYKAGVYAERVEWGAKLVKAEQDKQAAFERGLAHVQAAETVYHETIRTLPPITNTIIERSAAYAATPEGSAVCLPAARVGLLAETRDRLFPAPAPAVPGGSAGTVSADAVADQP